MHRFKPKVEDSPLPAVSLELLDNPSEFYTPTYAHLKNDGMPSYLPPHSEGHWYASGRIGWHELTYAGYFSDQQAKQDAEEFRALDLSVVTDNTLLGAFIGKRDNFYKPAYSDASSPQFNGLGIAHIDVKATRHTDNQEIMAAKIIDSGTHISNLRAAEIGINLRDLIEKAKETEGDVRQNAANLLSELLRQAFHDLVDQRLSAHTTAGKIGKYTLDIAPFAGGYATVMEAAADRYDVAAISLAAALLSGHIKDKRAKRYVNGHMLDSLETGNDPEALHKYIDNLLDAAPMVIAE